MRTSYSHIGSKGLSITQEARKTRRPLCNLVKKVRTDDAIVNIQKIYEMKSKRLKIPPPKKNF